jgi:hypothetical protein
MIQTARRWLAHVLFGSSQCEICDGQSGTGMNFLRIILVARYQQHSNKVPCLLDMINPRTNSDLCHLQHKLIGFYSRDEKCLQRGTDWVFK